MLGSALSHLGDGKELLEACFGALVRAAGVHDQRRRPNDKYGYQNRALALGELDEHLIPSGAAEIRRALIEEEKQRGEPFEPEQRDAAVRRISNQLYFSEERREFFQKIREKIELLRTIVSAAEKAEQGNFRFAEVKGVLCGLEMFFSDIFLEPLFKEALGENYYSKLVPWRQELKLFIDQMEPPNARRQAA